MPTMYPQTDCHFEVTAALPRVCMLLSNVVEKEVHTRKAAPADLS